MALAYSQLFEKLMSAGAAADAHKQGIIAFSPDRPVLAPKERKWTNQMLEGECKWQLI